MSVSGDITGGDGGVALLVDYPLTIENNGVIAGGGGGGTGGLSDDDQGPAGGGAGGAGAGIVAGTGGTGGTGEYTGWLADDSVYSIPGGDGGAGSLTAPGLGGIRGYFQTPESPDIEYGFPGHTGGGLGQDGEGSDGGTAGLGMRAAFAGMAVTLTGNAVLGGTENIVLS